MRSLEGCTAVVTGGARGIGQAIATRFVQEGASVAVLDINFNSTQQSDQLRFVACDVSRDDEVRRAVQEVTRELGSPSVLVNNAGVNAYFDAAAMSEADWESVLSVDLKGAWLCCKYVLPAMVAARRGSIINISSIHAVMTSRGMFPYAAAKSGLLGLTRNLALDYAPQNIRVNAICPGFIRTHLVDEWLQRQAEPSEAEARMLAAHPLGRIGAPEDVANLAWFLASDQASYITGASFMVDGGLSAQFAS